MPAVSICLPVRGSDQFADKTIESIQSQDFEDWELIVAPSSSAVETAGPLTGLAERDKRIHILPATCAGRLWSQLNECLAYASAHLVKPILSGDELVPAALSRFVERMAQDKDVVLTTAAERLITDDGIEVESRLPQIESETPESGDLAARHSLLELKNHYGSLSSVVFKREFAVQGFDCRFFRHADWHLWLKTSLFGSVVSIPQSLCAARIYRRVPDENLAADTLLLLRDYLLIRDEFCEFLVRQGISREQWHALIRTKIEDTFAALAAGHKLDQASARYAQEIALADASPETVREMCRAYGELVFEGFQRIAELKKASHTEVVVVGKEVEKQLSQAIDTIGNMERSASWRLTEPLRRFRSMLANL